MNTVLSDDADLGMSDFLVRLHEGTCPKKKWAAGSRQAALTLRNHLVGCLAHIVEDTAVSETQLWASFLLGDLPLLVGRMGKVSTVCSNHPFVALYWFGLRGVANGFFEM